MARTLITTMLVAFVGCANVATLPTQDSNPSMLNQKLLADVVASAFSRVDDRNLRRFVNGKNIAIQVATTFPTEQSIVRAHASLLLSRAGASRVDLARGGDVLALVVLRAYGTQHVAVDDGHQQRGFLMGDLILQRPGSGEIYREAVLAKAIDHYYSDGTRERRNIGSRKKAQSNAAPPRRDPEPEPEPEPEAEQEPEVAQEAPAVERRERKRPSRSSRSRAREPREDAAAKERKRRAARDRARAREAEAKKKKAEKAKKDRRKRRRRRPRQPLILE